MNLTTLLPTTILIAAGHALRDRHGGFHVVGDRVSFDDSQPTAESWAAEMLHAAKRLAKDLVDAQAEERRAMLLTPGAGQSLEYRETAREALAADAAPDPLAPADWPMLNAELLAQVNVGIAATLRGVISEVLVERATWLAAGAEIKRIRRQAKLEIDDAATIEQVDAIVSAVAWPAV